MLYDRFDSNAELITDESGEHDKQSYFYSTNELLTVDGKTQQQKYWYLGKKYSLLLTIK